MTVIPIMLYHSVCDDPPPWIAPYTVTSPVFARHLDLIVASGRTAMTVSDLAAALAGRTRLPERPVVLTFDDGFADFADAAERLAERGLPSTLYVTTGALLGPGSGTAAMAIPPAPMLHWSQLAELDAMGVEIGAHSHTHPQLDALPATIAAEEIRLSKAMLEAALSHEVPSFAYPHGFHSARTRRMVESAGFRSACAVRNMLSSDSDEPLSLARLTVRSTVTAGLLSEWLNGRGARTAPQPQSPLTAVWRWYRRARGPASTRGVIANVNTNHQEER